MPRVHRFNVNLSEGAWRDLSALAEAKGKTVADVLRDAIALEVWFHRQVEEGNRILVERSGGRIREVIPRG